MLARTPQLVTCGTVKDRLDHEPPRRMTLRRSQRYRSESRSYAVNHGALQKVGPSWRPLPVDASETTDYGPHPMLQLMRSSLQRSITRTRAL
jgi:hypothetical protein